MPASRKSSFIKNFKKSSPTPHYHNIHLSSFYHVPTNSCCCCLVACRFGSSILCCPSGGRLVLDHRYVALLESSTRGKNPTLHPPPPPPPHHHHHHHHRSITSSHTLVVAIVPPFPSPPFTTKQPKSLAPLTDLDRFAVPSKRPVSAMLSVAGNSPYLHQPTLRLQSS
jgi:hypothetical protein